MNTRLKASRRTIATLRTLLVALPLMVASSAHAFCVYNKTDKKISFTGEGFKGMKGQIGPNKSACCNWQNKDCNSSKKRTATLEAQLIAGYTQGALSYNGDWCGIFVQGAGASLQHQAGGYLVVERATKRDWNKPADETNPSFVVRSYGYDNKELSGYTCPASHKKFEPRDLLNFISG